MLIIGRITYTLYANNSQIMHALKGDAHADNVHGIKMSNNSNM